jgi:hypothetical protein
LYNRPEVAAVLRDLVPPHKIKKKYIEINLRDLERGGMDWIDLPQDRD